MAVGVHLVNVELVRVNSITGDVLATSSGEHTIREHLNYESQIRVIPNDSIPNSVGRPTVPEYLSGEAADAYVLEHIDQSTVVTYLRDATGGFPAP
jgi:hypothetical protein